jgi:hypothetical protein
VNPVGHFDVGFVGRLGNALFQLAATIGVAESRDVLPRFNGDWTHRPFFSVPDDWFVDPRDLERRADGRRIAPGCDLVDDGPELAHIRPEYRVYAQDRGLFHRSIGLLRTVLQPSELGWDMIDAASDAYRALPGPVLAVHVRRGDNVVDPGVPNKHEYFVLPTLDYYVAAVRHQLDQRPFESIAFFSDDPAWVEAELAGWARDVLGLEVYVHHGTTRPKEHEPGFETAPISDAVDVALMAMADGHVVTGSTFGIWSAYLAGRGTPTYCWPVYGARIKADASLMFPKTWTRLELARC